MQMNLKKQIAGMAIANNYAANKANKMCELIEQQPTAYDVDKVVEEMQDLLWDCYTDSGVGIDRKTGFEAYKREMERILRH